MKQFISDETMKQAIKGIEDIAVNKDNFYATAYGSLWASNVTRLYTPDQMREIALAWAERYTEIFGY